ncbi:MAG: hypothetical protein FWH41_10590 [Treponema sp.]|nr:hypothetical protein [Treponema sp.]
MAKGVEKFCDEALPFDSFKRKSGRATGPPKIASDSALAEEKLKLLRR